MYFDNKIWRSQGGMEKESGYEDGNEKMYINVNDTDIQNYGLILPIKNFLWHDCFQNFLIKAYTKIRPKCSRSSEESVKPAWCHPNANNDVSAFSS